MNTFSSRLGLAAVVASCTLFAACGTTGGGQTTAAAPASGGSKIWPDMNERGDVVDPKKVASGYGQKVKGLDGWEGEIIGNPAPGSKFGQLKIGMSSKQAMDIAGTPTDQSSCITGKAFIPFFFGSDR